MGFMACVMVSQMADSHCPVGFLVPTYLTGLSPVVSSNSQLPLSQSIDHLLVIRPGPILGRLVR